MRLPGTSWFCPYSHATPVKRSNDVADDTTGSRTGRGRGCVVLPAIVRGLSRVESGWTEDAAVL